MCGIVGISYGPEGPLAEDWTPSELLQILLPASVHRGPHAYGWMYLTRDGVIHTAKFKGRSDARGAARKMVIPEEHEPHLVWLVGHVRFYTNGSPDVMLNNHPIDHGKIVGVHNGVIRNFREVLEETGRQDEATEVDSEAIFAAINKWGHRAGLRRIRGDMVAVYANREKPETLHIARTHGRPLVFTHTAANGLLFASEEGIAEATGMAASAYSALSTYRLVRAKGGRIVERIALQPAPTAWRRFEGGPDHPGVPDRDDIQDDSLANTYSTDPRDHVPAALRQGWTPRGGSGQPNQNMKTPPVRSTVRPNLSEIEKVMAEAPEKVTRPSRPSRNYARSSTYKDGDVVGTNKVYYKGLLLTAEEYADKVTGGKMKSSLDES